MGDSMKKTNKRNLHGKSKDLDDDKGSHFHYPANIDVTFVEDIKVD